MIETRNIYVQLLELCQQQLSGGRWVVGERFPSERELALEHGISRATANKVLAKLASEGWLEIRRGSGAFIAERPTLLSELRQLDSFTDFARANDLIPRTLVITCENDPKVSDEIRTELGLSSQAHVLRVERLRRLNGVTVIHEQRWLPTQLYPDLKARNLEGSFYALCRERYGLVVDHEDVIVRACLPPAQSEFRDVPTLQVIGTGYDADARPLWSQCLHYRGDCFELHHSAETNASLPRLSLRLNPQFLSRLKPNGSL